jgi:hypothetical protein
MEQGGVEGRGKVDEEWVVGAAARERERHDVLGVRSLQ